MNKPLTQDVLANNFATKSSACSDNNVDAEIHVNISLLFLTYMHSNIYI